MVGEQAEVGDQGADGFHQLGLGHGGGARVPGHHGECPVSGQSGVRFARCPETGRHLSRNGTDGLGTVPYRDEHMAPDLQSLDIT
jgi:hypothetical protein